MTYVGVDLGTTNSVVAIMEGRQPLVLKVDGDRLLPSVVSYDDGGEWRGRPAIRRAGLIPHHTFSGVKRLIGRDFADPVTQECLGRALYGITAAPKGAARLVGPNREYTPIEISARVLAKLKEAAEDYLDEKVTDAVIAVPAYFNDAQRKATREAGKIAGFKEIRILSEPTAAALAYGFKLEDKEMTIAVYDLGGGTFDISIVKIGGGDYEVLATNGDAFLGGDDFDQRIVDYLVAGFEKEFAETGVEVTPATNSMARVVYAVEEAKKELSVTKESRIYIPSLVHDMRVPAVPIPLTMDYNLTRDELEAHTADLVERTLEPCRRAMADARLAPEQIDRVVLVGGMTRMPLVRRAVEKFFGKPPVRGIDADEAVAAGAAIFAGMITGKIEGVKVLDIAPHDLGIRLGDGSFHCVVPRGTQIPVQKVKQFSTSKDNQDAVTIRIEQASSDGQRFPLAQAHMAELEPAPKGTAKVLVSFGVNRDGEVEANATEVNKGLTAKAKAVI